MPIEFYNYFFWASSIWAWIFLIVELITYIFLILGSLELKKDERNFKKLKLLRIIAIILLIWRIIHSFLLPNVILTSPTPSEIIFGFIYSFIFKIYWVVHLTFGIAISIFQSKNKEQIEKIILLAGILYAVAAGMNLILGTIVPLMPISFFTYMMMLSVLLVITIIFLSSGIIILVFSIQYKRKFIIIYAVLNLILILPRFLLTLVYPGIGGF